MQLSKSDYMLFLKHPAWVWLKKHRKQILPEPDAALKALFASGNRYERYAEQLFPGAQTLGWSNFGEYRTLPKRTQEALTRGADTIFQGGFQHGRTSCIIDVLKRVEGSTFDLFEIKASTSVKRDHISDLAFQVSVLEGAGMTIRNVGVVHVNRDYVRDGELDAQQLSSMSDISTDVRERMKTTGAEIEKALETIDLDDMPDPSPRHAARGSIQDWLEIYKLVAPEWDGDSIYELTGVQPDDVGELEDAFANSIADIPHSFKLSKRQLRQVRAVRSGKPIIERDAIRRYLDQLTYPLYFLDYETFSDVVPAFDGLRPYQQVPFQYSLHIQREPGSKLEHREYLHVENSNPIEPLLEHMRKDIGDTGSIVVWYAPFESGRNEDMAILAPHHASFLHDVNARIVDLMDPFQDGHYIDAAFRGSASIKKVLPVLAPDLSYSDLEIGDGATAQQAWMDVVLRGNNLDSRDEVLANLSQYCALDTLAMVRIFEALDRATQKSSFLDRMFGT